MTPPPLPADGYLMDDRREAGRLIGKVDADEWVATYLQRLLAPDQHILEVGCGPGHLLAAASRAAPGIDAFGVDCSAGRLAGGVPDGVSIALGEATQLPFADDRFDVVYTRFMLEYLRDPTAAVREMVRVCGPRGTLVLQDLDAQLVTHYPPDPDLDRGLARVMTGLEGRLDPFIGRKLFSMALRCGLTNINCQVQPYHLIAGSADPETLRLWELKLDVALPAAASVIGQRPAAALRDRLLDYLRRPDTVTYSMVFTVSGNPGTSDAEPGPAPELAA